MKAQIIRSFGGPELFEAAELPDPVPGPGQVLVRQAASSVNPVDTKLRANGGPMAPELPAVLGCDVAGIVEALGPGVTALSPGDAVFGCGGGVRGQGGAYAERIAVDARFLARMPAGNLQTLGNARSKQRGASGGRMQGQYLSTNATAGSNPHVGFIFHSDFVQGVPPSLRTRAFRVLSGKATLMARVDASRSSPLGEAGRDMLAQLQAKGDKWQEAAPARVAKALPAPIEKTAKKRGGKRLRARKENYATTEMAKAQNRLAFGKQEQEVIDGDEMEPRTEISRYRSVIQG